MEAYQLRTLSRFISEIEILRFGVKRKFQLQGNGKILLKSLISLLKQKNYNRMFLEVNTSNSGAISLYKQFGFFIDISIRKNYYFETGIYYDAKNYTTNIMIKHDKKFLIDFLGLHPFLDQKKAPTITNLVLELKKIEEKAKNCKSALYESRKSVVFGSGDLTRPWMFVRRGSWRV